MFMCFHFVGKLSEIEGRQLKDAFFIMGSSLDITLQLHKKILYFRAGTHVVWIMTMSVILD